MGDKIFYETHWSHGEIMSPSHNRTLVFTALILMILVNAGCSSAQNKPSSTQTPPPQTQPAQPPKATSTSVGAAQPSATLKSSPLLQATPTPTQKSQVSASATPGTTQTPSGSITQGAIAIPNIATLPGGNYLLYLTHRASSPEGVLSLIAFAPSSKLNAVLYDGIPGGYIATSRLSGDKSSLAYLEDPKTMVIVDLIKRSANRIPIDHDCSGLSWSPKGDQMALACGDIFVYTLKNNTFEPLTTSAKANEWSAPAWSPDGKWIAYIHPAESMPPVRPTATPTVSYKTKTPQPTPLPLEVKNPLDGLYVVNTDCLIKVPSCKSFTHFAQVWLYAPAPPVWSQNSQRVALYDTGTMTVYNPVCEYQREIDLQELHTATDWAYQPVSWSPDEEWLALSGPKTDPKSQLSIVSISALTTYNMITTDAPITMVDWIALPTLQKDQSYYVSMAGDTLSMHETPSVDGTLVKRLKHGDTFTIIDGPVYAEGYIWWNIREKITRMVGWVVEIPAWFVNSQNK